MQHNDFLYAHPDGGGTAGADLPPSEAFVLPSPHLVIDNPLQSSSTSPPSTITILLPSSLSSSPVNNHIDQYTFPFTRIFPPSTPLSTLHSTLSLPLLYAFTTGTNTSLLTLGALASGKTFAMVGGRDYAERGLVPRAIEWVLDEGERQRAEWEWDLTMSHVEVYHEALTDLLAASPAKELSIREDDSGAITVKHLSRAAVTGVKQAMALYTQSLARRHTAAHPLNPSSSRSHSLLTLHLARRHRLSSRERVEHSKLHLVDLAGMERLGKNPNSSASSPALLREAKSINRSLSYLEQVVVALTAKQPRAREFIPWRQCRLTLLLKDCIVGGRCAVLACIDSQPSSVEDAVNVCKLSDRMQHIENALSVNVEHDAPLLAERRLREVEALKEELRMYDQLHGRGARYDAYSAAEQVAVREEVLRYVRGEVEDIDCDSMRKVREVFRQMKATINAAPAAAPSGLNLPASTAPPAAIAAAQDPSTRSPRGVRPWDSRPLRRPPLRRRGRRRLRERRAPRAGRSASAGRAGARTAWSGRRCC